MKSIFRRPSPAMIVACAALFLAGTGAGVAVTTALPKGSVGTAQLKNNAVVSSKVKNRSLKAVDFAKGQLPRGARGATGATGVTGATGIQGASGVVSTGVFVGLITIIPGSTASYVFVGNTVNATTTASQRLTGAAEVPLDSPASATGQSFDYGLCYQPSTGGTISNFATSYSTADAYPDSRSFAASASAVPGAGTWKVGFCVRNDYGPNAINSDWVNGWVQVTN